MLKILSEVENEADGVAISKLGQEGIARFESLPFPTVAAIHGDCLGGGLEVTLACTARVASNSKRTKMALPEVMLGILPGAGGTQRLPKIVGLQAALDMMLTGRNISPKRALKMGLVSEIVPKSQLISAAKSLALRLAKGQPVPAHKVSTSKRLQDGLLEGNPMGRSIVFSQARKMVMKQTKGKYPAPIAILEAAKLVETMVEGLDEIFDA